MTTHIREPTHLSISSNSPKSVVQSCQAGNVIESYREVGAGKPCPAYIGYILGLSGQLSKFKSRRTFVDSIDSISMCMSTYDIRTKYDTRIRRKAYFGIIWNVYN